VTAQAGLRLTSRIVVMDPTGAILLFMTQAPDSSGFHRWITPGGGVDPGESHYDAALRELYEETGQRFDSLQGPVWSYDFEVSFDQADHDRGHAEYFFVTTGRFEPLSEFWTPEEHVDVTAWGWFSATEIETSKDPYEPAHLPTLVRDLTALL
jgi:8-oxo-dGTP pyrophosphatase MutT (NUDIX family)